VLFYHTVNDESVILLNQGAANSCRHKYQLVKTPEIDFNAMKEKQKYMLDTIRREAKSTASYTGSETFDERVMQAMQAVDREAFVPSPHKDLAFDDGPLPIGYGQTISQPYMVALMTHLVHVTTDSVVLEIGTGSGYQAAVLAHLVRQVFTIEKIPELAESARQRLQALGYENIEVRSGSGYHGWKEKAPFDAIIVTAAATHIPQSLVDQLKPGARMVIPIGLPYMYQELMLVTKGKSGTIHTESVLGVSFVPFVTADDEAPL
jgi:protein-L-isoaspartate(D-aspartate) O-methyltransferase